MFKLILKDQSRNRLLTRGIFSPLSSSGPTSRTSWSFNTFLRCSPKVSIEKWNWSSLAQPGLLDQNLQSRCFLKPLETQTNTTFSICRTRTAARQRRVKGRSSHRSPTGSRILRASRAGGDERVAAGDSPASTSSCRRRGAAVRRWSDGRTHHQPLLTAVVNTAP